MFRKVFYIFIFFIIYIYIACFDSNDRVLKHAKDTYRQCCMKFKRLKLKYHINPIVNRDVKKKDRRL